MIRQRVRSTYLRAVLLHRTCKVVHKAVADLARQYKMCKGLGFKLEAGAHPRSLLDGAEQGLEPCPGCALSPVRFSPDGALPWVRLVTRVVRPGGAKLTSRGAKP